MTQEEINELEWKNPDNWSLGLYFSKKDSRTWVPKSIPSMGWTTNIGKSAGAIWFIALLGGIPMAAALLMTIAFAICCTK